jgi:F-type H+-transporting ATPase subunit b
MRLPQGGMTIDMHLLAFAEQIQLFPDGTLVIHVALILLMIYVLNRTLYRPINRVLDARAKNRGNYFGEAEEIRAKVEEKELRYSNELRDARSAGYELIEKEQKKAAAAREKKLAEAKTEVADRLASGRSEIEQRASDARAELTKEADKLADKVASGILK